MSPRALLVLVGAVAGLTGAASPAWASTISYQCGNEICGIDPATGAKRTFTSGGTEERPNYGGTISRDGRIVSWAHAGVVFTAPLGGGGAAQVGDGMYSAGLAVRMSPAGDGWLWHQDIFTGPYTGSNNYTYLLAGTPPDANSIAVNAFTSGWLGKEAIGAFEIDDQLPTTPQSRVCVIAAGPENCVRPVVTDATRLLSFPDGSPDGKTVVVAAEPQTGQTQTFRGSIALYSVATGGPVRDLTTGPSDSIPAFSPAGDQVVFERDGGIWIVPVAGGAPRRIVDGVNPSWGGGSLGGTGGGAAAPRVTASAVSCARRSGRCTLRGTATGAARVDASVVRSRGSRCEAWSGSRWVRSTCAQAAKRRVRARLASGRWTLAVRGLRTGTMRLAVRATSAKGLTTKAPARRSVRVR